MNGIRLNKQTKISSQELRQYAHWEKALGMWVRHRLGQANYHSAKLAQIAKYDCVRRCEECNNKVFVGSGDLVGSECWKCGSTNVKWVDYRNREIKFPIEFWWLPNPKNATDMNAYTCTDFAIDFDNWLAQVGARARQVMIDYFVTGMSYREVGNSWNITDNAVREIVTSVKKAYKGEQEKYKSSF